MNQQTKEALRITQLNTSEVLLNLLYVCSDDCSAEV